MADTVPNWIGTSSCHRLEQTGAFLYPFANNPYIVLDSETYISLKHQELRTCKNIGYEFYCEELFIVKHKSKYSYESAIYFSLSSEIIHENCNFAYYFNKTVIKPAVFDGSNKIIVANLPNNKHIECNINNNITVKIPSFPYVLVNRSVLCNCEIEVEKFYFRIFGCMSWYTI